MEYFDSIFMTLHQFAINFVSHTPNIIVSIILLIAIHYISVFSTHLLGASLSKTLMRTNLIQVFQKLTGIMIWTIGILVVSAILFPSVTPANILATLGLTSVAIGFAFKDIFENYLAGIFILLREPFHIGDYIKMKDQEGDVEHISVRNTHIRQSDGVRVVIPNSVIFNNPVQVLTDYELRRIQTDFTIAYGSNINDVRELINNIVMNCTTVSKDKYIHIYVNSLTSNGIYFEIYWWTKSRPSDIRASRDEVLSRINNAFIENDIEIPHSYTVNFQEPLVVTETLNDHTPTK